jgi:hypothetical protein
MINRIFLYTIFLSICLYFTTCKSNREAGKNDLQIDTLFIEENTGNVDLFIMPSAELIFDLKNLDIQFKPDYIHSPEYYKSYHNILSKSLNLGIYVTDFTYLVSIDNTVKLKEYLNAIKYLSNDLNIRDLYTEDVMHKYLQNLHRTDSLYIYILETYDSFVNSLQSSNRTPMLITLSIGSMVELLYLISKNINSVEDFNKIQSEMKNYNFILDEYSHHARGYLSDPMVSEILPDLENLYQMLDMVSGKNSKSIIKKDGANLLVSKEGVGEIEYKNFIQIKDTIQSIRQKYITHK